MKGIGKNGTYNFPGKHQTDNQTLKNIGYTEIKGVKSFSCDNCKFVTGVNSKHNFCAEFLIHIKPTACCSFWEEKVK